MEIWEGAFRRYADIVQKTFSQSNKIDPTTRSRTLVKSNPWLRDEVERLEERSEFLELCHATHSAFDKREGVDTTNLWNHHIKNFFRRSGCYIDVFESKPINLLYLPTLSRCPERKNRLSSPECLPASRSFRGGLSHGPSARRASCSLRRDGCCNQGHRADGDD